MDFRGFLGVSEGVKVGYQNIRVSFKIEAQVSAEQKEELIRTAQRYSPVYNTIAQSAPASVQLDRQKILDASFSKFEFQRMSLMLSLRDFFSAPESTLAEVDIRPAFTCWIMAAAREASPRRPRGFPT